MHNDTLSPKNADFPQHIYHYCNVSVFQSIVQEKSRLAFKYFGDE